MQIWSALLIISGLFSISDSTKSDDDEEPHAYTISFFQFDPKDISGENKVKKDIKPSDSDRTSHYNKTLNGTAAGNFTSFNNTGININNTVADNLRNTTESEFPKHQEIATNSKNKTTANNTATVNNYATSLLNKTTSSMHNNTASLENNTIPTLQNNVTAHLQNNTFNNSTKVWNKTLTTKRSNAAQFKKSVLNPNPSPSAWEAEHYLSPEHKIVPEQVNKSKNPHVLAQANKTALLVKNESESKTTNSLTLTKMKEANNKTEEKSAEENALEEERLSVQKEENKNGTFNDNGGNLKNNTELSKLEKDKKTNENIQEMAKNIKPVQNKVDIDDNNSNISNTWNFDEPKERKNSIQENVLQKKTTTLIDEVNIVNVTGDNVSLYANVSHAKNESVGNKHSSIQHDEKYNKEAEEKSRIAKHRKKLSEFVPLYKVSAKDRKLSFQRGALKHPKHDLYPKCHQCDQNSTYAHCVKKSTLLLCNKDLNNICFTRSTKKGGNITYQMGCADHTLCSNAKAFPCKDGSQQCFTCCQFDRCNSSPHHGDFELDQLKMDELSLDASGTASNIKSSWLYQLSIIIVCVLLVNHLM